MELLAPAGGWDQLRAAVLFGADAVYLAAEKFGMRARANNFALDDVSNAVAFAHAHGVKVHVTCNVMMTASDIDELPEFLAAIDAAGVDALIVGDLGAFSLAREYAPHVDLHVSTQASVMNARSARVWHELGATRIVCAREMSMADIARLRADTPADLEVETFVHGAMCMAYSGRCLISSYLTGRSANKGNCTQPCRWQYTLGEQSVAGEQLVDPEPGFEFALEEEKRPGEFFPVEEDEHGTFIMNARDLNMLEHLDELAAAGVDSIKIEGRNKNAFYVATVVGAYRRVLDGAPASQVAPELLTVSHRPYNTGFYFGPAHQAPNYDGYEQTCLHVADVLGSLPQEGEPEEAGAAATAPWRVYVRCRNRWEEGDELEALVPVQPVSTVQVRNLAWHPQEVNANGSIDVQAFDVAEDAGDAARKGEALRKLLATCEVEQAVAVANRSVAVYSFDVDEPLPAGSYLRIRQFRRSARHEG